MSELKAVHAFDVYEAYTKTGDDDAAQVYIKSEADKVIADLEESHKKEVGQLLMEIVELKKEKEYVIEHTTDVINGQEQELRNHKYKRCIAMAKWCESNAYIHEHGEDYDEDLVALFGKWHNIWLKIAKKFKEEK